MNSQQARSEAFTPSQKAATNGDLTRGGDDQENDLLSMVHAVSALLDDVTVPTRALPPEPQATVLQAKSAPMGPSPEAPLSGDSALRARLETDLVPSDQGRPQFDAMHASPLAQTEPMSAGAETEVGAIVIDDFLRPPWEIEERQIEAEVSSTVQAAQSPQPLQPEQPAWTIPASLFEPTPSPLRSETLQAQEVTPTSPISAVEGETDLAPNAITIRGKNQGVSIEIGAGPWADLMSALGKRLDQAAGFFRGGHVAVDVGARPLTEPELKTLMELLKAHGMELGVLRTVAERTFQSALALGVSATHETMEGPPMAVAQRAATNEDRFTYFVYRGNLRSGQVLERRDHVVVIGDVNPGAEVVSDGDIMVWGRLRGIAHAGAHGNLKSIIAALDLDPVQLRIDSIIAAAPSAHENGSRRPTSRAEKSALRRAEIARLVDNRLVIEPWDQAKTMGSPLLKRLRE